MAEAEAQLREAASNGDTATVAKLLEAGTAQTADEVGETPLHLSTSNYITDPKHVEVVRLLIDNAGNINAVNQAGNAPIHNAASYGHLEIIDLLIESEAAVDTEGEMGMVPLGLAALKKHHAVVDALLTHLIDQNKFNANQVNWITKVDSENQQLQLFRALNAIFQQKKAADYFIKFNVIPAILTGMKRFSKKSVHTAGLSLLTMILSFESGLKSAKESNVKDLIGDTCKQHVSDPVVAHMIENITSML